ncbi:MAG: hypothetical protein MI810_15920 [Flavobacteriales bacterium]|nr:hypothetical protein [Flavobacteriales bacterium]
MKKFCFYTLIIFSIIACKNSPETEQGVKPSTEKPLESSEIQGDWTAYVTTNKNINEPGEVLENSPNEYQIINWRIKGDTITSSNCLCELEFKRHFKLKNDLLYFSGFNSPYGKVSLEDDQLIIEASTKDESSFFLSFSKDSFDDKKINLIERNLVDYQCLSAQLNLVTYFEPEDEAPYTFDYPINLPESIQIQTIEEAKNIYNEGIINLGIDGQTQPFRLTKLEWNYNQSNTSKHIPFRMEIEPTNWWKETSFRITYESQNADSENWSTSFKWE